MYFLYVCFYHVQYVCHRIMHIVWYISYKASIKCIRRVDVLIDSVSSNLRDCAAAQLPKHPVHESPGSAQPPHL